MAYNFSLKFSQPKFVAAMGIALWSATFLAIITYKIRFAAANSDINVPHVYTQIGKVQNDINGDSTPIYDESTPPLGFPSDWETGVKNMDELGTIFTNSGQGVGVVLGVGPAGKFARHFLKFWTNGILYMCDPFIHVFNGYDDKEFNVDDRTHQLNFENLRTALVLDKSIQGRYSMVREFSFSFFRLWIEKKYDLGQHPPRFVYIDNNPATQAVLRDLRDWWQVLLPGGVMAGPRIFRPDVLEAVKTFSAEMGVKPVLYLEPWPGEKPGGPGWVIVKPNEAEFYDAQMGGMRTLGNEEL